MIALHLDSAAIVADITGNVVLETLFLLLRESYIIGDSHSNLALESLHV